MCVCVCVCVCVYIYIYIYIYINYWNFSQPSPVEADAYVLKQSLLEVSLSVSFVLIMFD